MGALTPLPPPPIGPRGHFFSLSTVFKKLINSIVLF